MTADYSPKIRRISGDFQSRNTPRPEAACRVPEAFMSA